MLHERAGGRSLYFQLTDKGISFQSEWAATYQLVVPGDDATVIAMKLAVAASTVSPPVTVLLYDEKVMAANGNSIGAIKSVRARSGLGLKDAKDLVDRWMLCDMVLDYKKTPSQ